MQHAVCVFRQQPKDELLWLKKRINLMVMERIQFVSLKSGMKCTLLHYYFCHSPLLIILHDVLAAEI